MDAWDELFRDECHRWSEPDEAVVGFISTLKARGCRRILDLGCGAGRHLVLLAQEGFLVVGVDISPRGLYWSQQRAAAQTLEQFVLVRHDMVSLPFPDEHFDAVISVNVIHHNRLAAIEDCVTDIRRVLRPRGSMLATLISTDDYKFGLGTEVEPHTFVVEDDKEAGLLHHFFAREEVEKLMARGGLEAETIQETRSSVPEGENVHWAVTARKSGPPT